MPRSHLWYAVATILLVESLPWIPAAASPTAPAAPFREVSEADPSWVMRYNGPGNSDDHAVAVRVSPDGSRVFVTGSSWGTTSGLDFATVAYDASGDKTLLQWVKRYNGPGNSDDNAVAVRVSPDGSRVFVTGPSWGTTSGLDFATVAYDASTGTELWVKRYNGRGNVHDIAWALKVSPDGTRVFVTGESTGDTGTRDTPHYTTVAYDASTGTELWVKRYNGPGNAYDAASALGVSPDGSRVFVTGVSWGATDSYDFATVAYDASTGTELWVNRYNGPGNAYDAASALGVSPDGSRVFVTGVSWGATGEADFATVAYDASAGAELWVKRYNGPGNTSDAASALGVSPDGSRVFVTGPSWGLTSDYATVAYDASTGAELWVKRYNGPGKGDDTAFALALSPDGSMVFVTGQSTGVRTGRDYATVAYAVA